MITSRAEVFLLVTALTGVLALPSCGGAPEKPSQPAAAGQSSPSPDTPEPSTTAPPSEQAAGDDQKDANYDPARAAGAVKGVPAPGNTAPLVAVANYFAELPGVNLGGLKPRQREAFLQRVNSELCTCGCKNDTLARCYVNDPSCPVVKGMVQAVLDEVKAGK